MGFAEWWAELERNKKVTWESDKNLARMAFEAGIEHEREVRDRPFTEPGVYTKLAEEIQAERIADDYKREKVQ